MKVVLPDGSDLTVADGATAADVAADHRRPSWRKPRSRSRSATGSSILPTPLQTAIDVAIITAVVTGGLDIIRHSAAHVLADAATRLFPGTKVAIGPAIKDGFYYDFEFPQPVGEDDLPRLTEEIQRSARRARRLSSGAK